MAKRLTKLEREAMTYEVTEEDTTRRRAIPRKDKRDTERAAARANIRRSFNNNLLIKAVTMNKEIILFTIGVWSSGFMAAKGLEFWSLLALVLAILIPTTLAMITLQKRDEE